MTYMQKTVAWKRGLNTLYAGTPLDAEGNPVNDATAVGILAEDVTAPDRTAKILTAGSWDEDAHTGSGIAISDAVKEKLKDITFSRPMTMPRAAATAAGIVKQAATVSYAANNPTKAEFNALITALKDAGIVKPDNFNLSVLAAPTPASMPTEETASNSGHATVTMADNLITVTLDCEAADLANANHGATWGTHKWLGFGVRTGLASVVGVKFTDDTGASATLDVSDASEATALGLSAGDFILYIKAEDPKYLTGEKCFTLQADGCEPETVYMQIVES